MMSGDNAAAAVSLAEAQAYARVETGEEEAVLAGLVRSASALCEQFTGQVLVARGFVETMHSDGGWQRLALTPVRAIDGVETVDAAGVGTALIAGQFEVDIDSRGDGWVRVGQGGQRDSDAITTTIDIDWADVPALAGQTLSISLSAVGPFALSRPVQSSLIV